MRYGNKKTWNIVIRLQCHRNWTAFEKENTKHSNVLSAHRNTQTHTHTHIYSCSAFRNGDRGWDVQLQVDGSIIAETVTARMGQSSLQWSNSVDQQPFQFSPSTSNIGFLVYWQFCIETVMKVKKFRVFFLEVCVKWVGGIIFLYLPFDPSDFFVTRC
jgi:hypothetical protein